MNKISPIIDNSVVPHDPTTSVSKKKIWKNNKSFIFSSKHYIISRNTRIVSFRYKCLYHDTNVQCHQQIHTCIAKSIRQIACQIVENSTNQRISLFSNSQSAYSFRQIFRQNVAHVYIWLVESRVLQNSWH